MEKYDQKKLSLSEKFGMLLSGLDTYFLQLGARFPSNVATKAFFEGKKIQTLAIVFLEQKRRSATKKNDVSAKDLASLYLVQLHIFWKEVHVFQ